MHGTSFVLFILTYRAFSHGCTGRWPYAQPAYQAAKGDSGGGEGKKGGESPPTTSLSAPEVKKFVPSGCYEVT